MPRTPLTYRTMPFVAAIASMLLLAACSLRSGREISPDDFSVRGIDISAHNGAIDFDAVKADGISFVYIKATEGADFKDPAFVDNYRKARNAGLKIGAYHFFRFNTPGHSQAINLLHSVASRRLDMPLVIDLEEWTNDKNMHTDSIAGNLIEMITHLTDAGVPVMIYTNKDGYDRFVFRRLSHIPLWLCSFTDIPASAPWTMWQHSHSGVVHGVRGHVDTNVFHADSAAFSSWAKPYYPLSTQ